MNMRLVATGGLIGLALVLLAPPLPNAMPGNSLDGNWLSDGYGIFAEIKGDHCQKTEVYSRLRSLL